MKSLILIISIFTFSNIYSQDSFKIKQIDSLVNIIIHSEFPTQRDSVFQEMPGIGLSMKTYLTLMTYGKELKKYITIVEATQLEKGISKKTITGTAFYYNENKLIKVEEFAIQDNSEQHISWYFEYDKCLFYTSKSEKAKDRCSLLLMLSKEFLKKALNQP